VDLQVEHPSASQQANHDFMKPVDGIIEKTRSPLLLEQLRTYRGIPLYL
jgi:hypothetical protein